jgi:hypothetical protein
MNEIEALKQLELVCGMMATCRETGMHDKAEQYAENLHKAYRTWFDAWRDNDYNRDR